MNAPAPTKHLETPELELLPLAAICPSETHIQAKRRAHYNVTALEELAASIRADGLLQPVVVRPLPALRGLAKYELVAGERRWLACRHADHAHILARIVHLDDAQVLKAQLVENLQREGLDPLAEAAGYHELIAAGVNADAIADMIGKSRSYVYARVQLLKLCPAVREALEKGTIDASQALAFSRIPTAKLQEQALHTLDKWSYQGHGEKLSFRRTVEILRDKQRGVMVALEEAPFRLDDESLSAGRGADRQALPACTGCPKRSGNDAELLAALDSANVCTDTGCYGLKCKATYERRRAEAEAQGRSVLAGDEAAAILPTDFGTRGFVDLDDACEDDAYPEPRPKGGWEDPAVQTWEEKCESWQPRTYRQLLGDAVAGLELQLVQDPKRKGRLRELAPDKDVARLLKARGIKARIARDTRKPVKPQKAEDPAKAAARAEREAREREEQAFEQRVDIETCTRLLKAAHDAWKGPLKHDELELVACFMVEDCGWNDDMEAAFGAWPGVRKKLAGMNERDLGRLMVLQAITGGRMETDQAALRALCKRLKIDPKAVEKDVRRDLSPKAEASAKPAPARKPAKTKGKK